jgi:hypothetical protein
VEKLEGHKLLFLDGHASHISIPVIELAIEKKIEIICLPKIRATDSIHSIICVAISLLSFERLKNSLNSLYYDNYSRFIIFI